LETQSGEHEHGAAPTDAPHRCGTHLCLIYDDERERREVVARFVADGVGARERIAYFTDGNPDDVPHWLREQGVDVPPPPQFSVSFARDVYCPTGEFCVEPMFGFWRAFYAEALSQGFAGARATGETSWSREVPGGEGIVEYEARLNDLLAELPVIALCQYDVHSFDGATILDILRVHPMMLIGGQVVQNPCYLKPEQFFASKHLS
jgi:hypothetical protein